MNEPFRLRYVNQIVGVFLIVVFLLSIAISIPFTSGLTKEKIEYSMNVHEAMANQLRTGTEVIILGETVGQVKGLSYVAGSDLVRVTFEIEAKHRSKITNYSEVTLDRKYGVGPAVIRLRRSRLDDEDETAWPPGESLTRIEEQDDQVERMAREVEAAGSSIDAAAQQIQSSLKDSFDPAFATTEQAFQSFQATSDEIRPEAIQTLTQLRTTTASLENELTQLSRRIDQLVDGEVRTTIGKIEDSAVAATEAAESVEKLALSIDTKTDKTNEDVAATLAALRDTAALIKQLTEETRVVVKIIRGEADELPGTTRQVKDTVDDTQELVGDIQSHWLLRRYRDNKTPTEQLSPSSLRGGGGR